MDDLVKIIKAELERQSQRSGPDSLDHYNEDDDGTVVNGYLNIVELAAAIYYGFNAEIQQYVSQTKAALGARTRKPS